MATLSTAAKNAALDAIVLLGETGAIRTGITLSLQSAGAVFEFIAPFPSPAFGAAVAGRADLLAPLDLANELIPGGSAPTSWQLITRDNQFFVTGGAVGSVGGGAEMEFSPSPLPFVFGQILRVATFSLEIA